ncbi:hypothetical protein nvc1_092 [Namao virus]|nr:hypothetical protein nvc1_092 [Namao virus]
MYTTVYVNSTCLNHGKSHALGSIGICVIPSHNPDDIITYSDFISKTGVVYDKYNLTQITSKSMDLLSCLVGITYIDKDKVNYFYTDSMYIYKMFVKWCKNLDTGVKLQKNTKHYKLVKLLLEEYKTKNIICKYSNISCTANKGTKEYKDWSGNNRAYKLAIGALADGIKTNYLK